MQVKNANLIEQVLRHYEGYNRQVHNVGDPPKKHFGIGHLVDKPQSDTVLRILGVRSRRELVLGWEGTDEQVEQVFAEDLNEVIEDIDKLDHFEDDEFNGLNEVRQAVVVSMNFQLGPNWPDEWPSCAQAIRDRDWDKAADNMLYKNPPDTTPSGWFGDTETRCKETAEAMRTGHWQRFAEYETEKRVHEDPNLRGGQGAPGVPTPFSEDVTDPIRAAVEDTLKNLPEDAKQAIDQVVDDVLVEVATYIVKAWQQIGNDTENQ